MTTVNHKKRHDLPTLDVSSIATRKLEEIVANDGVSSIGTDYGPLLPEIIDVLNRRKTARAERDHAAALSERARHDHSHPTHITCSNSASCLMAHVMPVAIEDAARQFYLDRRKSQARQTNVYRSECKACIKARENARHDRKRTNLDDANPLPF